MIENLSAVIVVDQKRLGGGSRSTVGTITDIAPLLRLLFSRAGRPYVGYANAFSFNDPEGMCPDCEGLGEIVDVDLDAFLDPSLSLNDGALRHPYFKGGTWMWQMYAGTGRFDPDKPIADFTDEERHALLYATGGKVSTPVGTSPAPTMSVVDVGLDYLRLGQPLNTLSGGECQRIKLATRLHDEGAIYVLDEPTTGPHMSDVEHLVAVLDRLVDGGNSVIGIEHNLDVVKRADWVIDLGPEGGSSGGWLLFAGTPRDFLDASGSHTAAFLRQDLVGAPAPA